MDSTSIVIDGKTWVDFAFHVFDKAWPYVAVAFGSFVTGWLGLHKPGFMQKKDGE